MNMMFQANDFFVRIREDSGRLKLTVWSKVGEKLVSEYISAASLENVWQNIASQSSAEVVDVVKEQLYG